MNATNYLECVEGWVQRTKLTPREIADQADIGYSWLVMFKRGLIKDPGYSHVHRLYEFAQSQKWR